MKVLFSIFSLLGSFAVNAVAAPIASGPKSDAPLTVSADTVKKAITCPKDIQNRAGGVVLLVHGTGSDGKLNWEGGPYLDILPDLDPGFDVCYVNLPNHALDDAQISAEYVVQGVKNLSGRSRTKKVHLIAHSQGNLNVQWALTFWPSIRSQVADYVALSGDFKGTTNGNFTCGLQNLISGGCIPAVIQQLPGSHFVKTLSNAGGLNALVTTTSLRTKYDEIVAPETGAAEQTSSFIVGASNIAIQDVCGAGHIVEHFGMVTDAPAFEIAYQAIKTGKAVTKDQIKTAACHSFIHAKGFKSSTFSTIPTTIKSAFYDLFSLSFGGPRVKDEPKIAAYAQPYDH